MSSTTTRRICAGSVLNAGYSVMPKITIASLERRISMLEIEKRVLNWQLSINGEFQLEAFKLLLEELRNKAYEEELREQYEGSRL